MIDRTAAVNGINLHYRDHAGGEPPLLVIHGLTANGRCFDGLLDAGLSPRFRAVVPDLRGRGGSEQPEGGYTLDDHAADLVALMNDLGLAQAVLVGHSYGGLLAMVLASTFPNRFPKLVLLDAAYGAADPRIIALIKPALDRLGVTFPSWDAYLASMRQAPYYQTTWDDAMMSYFEADVRTLPDGQVVPHTRPETIAQVSNGVRAADWAALLRTIRQLTLLLRAPEPYGTPDDPALISQEQVEATAALIPHLRTAEVPGNHMTMLYGTGAVAVVAAISAFVGEDA